MGDDCMAGALASLWNRHEAVFLAVLSVAVIAGSAVAGAAFLKTRQATDRGSARCYTVLSVGSGTTFTGTTIAAPGRLGSAEQVQSALAGCAALWRQGFLTGGATVQRPSQEQQSEGPEPVPTLVACTLPDGTAAIFPTQGPFTCGKLGLASPPSQPATP
ncbi:MAG: hypothetical protein QOD62_1845 [Actinomycetota bacterium]|nr:hypothetical protein [Actinomycetota bacterium]